MLLWSVAQILLASANIACCSGILISILYELIVIVIYAVSTFNILSLKAAYPTIPFLNPPYKIRI